MNNDFLNTYPKGKYDNFHFLKKNTPSFEGFYFKGAKRNGDTLVIICGYVRSKEKSHAFIQVSSQLSETCYFEYDIKDLHVGKNRFDFSIGQNKFNTQGIRLCEPNCHIDLRFSNFLPWKRTFSSPSIMGSLSRIPFVECKHDVIAPHLEVTGEVKLNHKEFEFNKDSGYIDKNWGSSFPKEYIWGHLSGFTDRSISIQFAKGKPKWLGFSIPVFVGFFKIKNEIHVFRSLKKGKINMINVGQQHLIMENKDYRIEAIFGTGYPLNLKAPVQGKMNDNIIENAGITTEVKIFNKRHRKLNQQIIHEVVQDATLEIQRMYA